MLLIIACLALLINTPETCSAKKYKDFIMDPADITAVLADNYTHAAPALENSAADICFGCADIKYDQGNFKIVECGDGIYMSLRATEIIMNNKEYNLVSPFWGLFWHQIAEFGLPVWHIEAISDKSALAVNEYKTLGVGYAASFAALEKSNDFQQAHKKIVQTPTRMTEYAGIIVFAATKEHTRDGVGYKKFQKQYPHFIYVNSATRDYLKQKDTTYKLFQRAGLDAFIPRFGIFPTTFNADTAKQITKLLPDNQLLVIKPTYSSLSIGVNVINAKTLPAFLRLILQHPETIGDSAPRALSFWRSTNQPQFVASEYVPSQTIYKNNKPYDPTMRVIFIMHHDQGTIHTNVLGGFWKIPVKPLNDASATETEKHVTIAHAGDYYSGILLEQAESLRMKKALAPVLAKAYEQMLIERK